MKTSSKEGKPSSLHTARDTNLEPLITQAWAKKSIANSILFNKQGHTATQQCSDVKNALSISDIMVPFTYRETSNDQPWAWPTCQKELETRQKSKPPVTAIIPTIKFWETISYTYLYYKLLHTKEDCLISANSNITFKGAQYITDEELSPLPQSDVVLDWMHAIGGPTFVKHVFHVFAKYLAIETTWYRIWGNK